MNTDGTNGSVQHGQVIFLTIILCILWILCILGNVLVCLVIGRSRRVQSTTNYFIVGLAGADLIFAIFVLPWIATGLLTGSWPLGDFMCRMTRFLQNFVLGVITFILTSICIDRFHTIIYPLTFKVTRGTAKRMIGVSCFASMVFSSFALYFYGQVDATQNNVTYVHCPLHLESSTERWTGLWYTILLLLIQYFSPAVIMFVLYTKVFRFIWRPFGTCLQFQRTMNSVPRTKVKMVKMLMITSLTSLLLITPIYFLHLIIGFVHPKNIDPFWYYACIVIEFSVSVLKPAIYMCYNSNFRRGCREVFCMSSMQCYRQEAYAITNISAIGRRNHIGVMNCAVQYCADSPSYTFDRKIGDKTSSWPLSGSVPSTSL